MSFDYKHFEEASRILRAEIQSNKTFKEFEEIVDEIEDYIFNNPNFFYKKYNFNDLTTLYDKMIKQYLNERDSRIASQMDRLQGLLNGYAKINIADLKLRITIE